jgi:hypothetical protein
VFQLILGSPHHIQKWCWKVECVAVNIGLILAIFKEAVGNVLCGLAVTFHV